MVTICINCRFFSRGYPNTFGYIPDDNCEGPDAPYSDFVTGRKDPQKINNGNCPYYQTEEPE